MEQTEQNLNDLSDGIIFGSAKEESNTYTVMTFIQSKKKRKEPENDLGHKFNILLFKYTNPNEKDVETFSAIIGDPQGYVDRVTKLGYSGWILKQKSFNKSGELKTKLASILKIYSFNDKLISKVLKETLG